MRTLFKLIIGVPIITTFIIAIVFIGLAVYETILGITGIFQGLANTEARPGLLLFQALDLFLIGFLFLIFSLGFAQLFFPKDSKISQFVESIAPSWLHVESFTQLKLILWDTVLTTLVVLFVGEVFTASGQYDWSLTMLPIGIFLISLAKYLIKKAKQE